MSGISWSAISNSYTFLIMKYSYLSNSYLQAVTYLSTNDPTINQSVLFSISYEDNFSNGNMLLACGSLANGSMTSWTNGVGLSIIMITSGNVYFFSNSSGGVV